MTTKIQKWGNSLAVRIPREITDRLSLREGSSVVVREDKNSIVIQHIEMHRKPIGKDAWKKYIIPTKRKKEHVSGRVDTILYGASR